MPKKGFEHSPESRAKMSAARKGKKTGSPSPETRAKISAALAGRKNGPQTLEHRQNISASLKEAMTPECRERISASLKKHEMTPEHRAAISAALEGRVIGPLSPEHRAEVSAGLKRYFDDLAGEEVLEHAVANRFVGTTALRYVLRERDGDLCQLCLEPIDFRLTRKTGEGWSASVDHVIPVRVGGPDDLDNLWLAHLGCNARKSVRWVGREDGTTDVRKVAA